MKRIRWFGFAVALVTLMIAGAGTAGAAHLHWDGGGGDNNWSNPANWDTAADGTGGDPGAGPAGGDTVHYTQAAVARQATGIVDAVGVGDGTGITIRLWAACPADITITIDTTLKLNAGTSLDLGAADDNFTMADGAGAITLHGVADFSVAATSSLTIGEGLSIAGGDLTVDGAGNTTLNGVVSGDQIFYKSGTGTLTFGAATNTFSGLLQINAGTVSLNNATAPLAAGTITMWGGKLLLNQGISAANWNRSITIGGAAEIETANGASVIDAGVTLNDALTVRGNQNLTFSTVAVSGASNLIVNMTNPANRVIMAFANTYSGTTTLTAGTLLYNAVMDNACNGAVSVASGATIGGTGSVKGAVTVASGGYVRPGDSGVGTLTAADFTFLGTSKMYVNIVGATKDVLAVTGTLSMPAGPSALVELEAGSSPNPSTAFAVVTAATYNSGGGVNTFANTALPAGWTVSSTDNVGITLNSPAAAPSGIPTLNEWGLIVLMMLLAGIGAYTLRRRHADTPMPV